MKHQTVTTLRRCVFAACALACAILASRALPYIKAQRERMDLNPYTDIANVSPGIELATKSLGCFRAIAIAALWVRATNLQDDGKFFELNDLFRLISQLEPRFASVWYYWAWNLAYNCSVKFPASQPEERWRWVQLGIEILRDRGIPVNPRSPTLYRELAWIYSHKIGQNMDDAHEYYKMRLALEMQEALGKPPYKERIEAMAAAPATQRELMADPAVRTLVEALATTQTDPFKRPLDVANRDPKLPPRALAILGDPAYAQGVERLDAFLRARHARDTLKLDLARMLKYTKDFGPIDWRLPDALALYWAARSVEIFGADPFHAANSDRLLFSSLVELYRRGRLRFEPPSDTEDGVWVVAPNFAFLEPIVRLHEEIVKRNEGTDLDDPTRDGFFNFLRDAILNLYLHTDEKNAQRYLRKLITMGGEPEMTLETFIERRYKELLKGITYEQATNLIRSRLFNSLFWVSLGFPDRAQGQDNLARFLYNKYAEDHPSDRFRLPPYRRLWLDALREAIIRMRPFQIEELRRLYTNDVKAVEEELKKLQQPRPAPAPPRTPPAPKP